MEATEAARATAPAVVSLPAGFMLDAATYERGTSLGFDGIDFYTAGRGGALGDVESPRNCAQRNRGCPGPSKHRAARGSP